MYDDELDKIMLLLGILPIVAIIFFVFASSSAMDDSTKNKEYVYSKINDNTTNAEIIKYINEACDNPVWYMSESGCRADLLKTFIIPART